MSGHGIDTCACGTVIARCRCMGPHTPRVVTNVCAACVGRNPTGPTFSVVAPAPTPAAPPFTEFPKIPRLRRDVVVSEKIDGTNACVHVTDDGAVLAGSRTRWVTPASDNYGFARWVKANEDELRTGLGPGTHYGEWWGQGIQRRYGLTEKRFSLFNVHRWSDDAVRPKCCHVVPVLARGVMSDAIVAGALELLATTGSKAAPGFFEPEGVVVYHEASGHLFKTLLVGDELPKGARP